MNKELIGATIGTSLSAVGTAIQVDEILKYVSLAITIIGGIISMIIIPLLNWYKNAKQDGKITKEEMEEGAQIVQNGIEQIQNGTKGKEDTK